MKLQCFTKILGIIFLLGFQVSVASTQKKVSQKPNIIFLFADDQSYGTIHALGNQEVITPNLDRLVEEGVTFTHAYNMGAWHGAVCLASRTMLNTGRFVWHSNKLQKKLKEPETVSQFWGNVMKRAGYDTYMSGKWHVHVPVEKVFQNVAHERPGMPIDKWNFREMNPKFQALKEGKSTSKSPEEFLPAGYGRPKNEKDKSWSPSDRSKGGYWEGGKHWSEVLKDDAISFINSASKKSNPFFMYLAFNAPHDPRQSPQRFVDMYPLENISLPETFMPEYPYKDQIGCGRGLRDEELAPFPRTPYAVKTHRQEYYAIITHLDEQIGKILDALDQSGQRDNTYIFYTADHGLACGNHGLMGKQNMYDHSMRAPLIVIGPDLPKDKKVDMDVYIQDIMPSSLEVAGIEKPGYVEFSSFMNLAKGKQKKGTYPAIYGCYKNEQRMIRKDGFKLIVYPGAKKVRLYNLKKDPLEMNDLSNKSSSQKKITELFAQLIELQKDLDDQLDLTAVFPELN